MDIVFATTNKGKLKEIRAILHEDCFNILSMEEAGIEMDVTEDGDSFSANAVKKASEIMKLSGKLTLADDSGLEIDYLDRKPGVYSARFLGEDTEYAVKNRKILEMMKAVPDEKRTARFVCVIAAVFPNGKVLTKEGVIEGMISHDIAGGNGFGYDPIFFIPEYNMTSAQLPAETKNRISHRGKALELIKPELLREYAGEPG